MTLAAVCCCLQNLSKLCVALGAIATAVFSVWRRTSRNLLEMFCHVVRTCSAASAESDKCQRQ